MAAFGGLIITNKGRALQAKAQIGTELKYTRIKIGDGHLGGQSIPTLTDLISPKMELGITNLEVRPGGKAVLGTVLRNSEVTTGFYFREIGVFALDPDEGEVLYCYGNAGPNAEYIPPGGGPDIIEKYIDVVTIVQNAPNVSAEIDKSLVFATHRDVDKALIEAKQYTDDEIQNITAETIGAIPISEKGEVDGVATLDEEGHVPEGQLQKAFNYTDEQIEPIENELTPNQKAPLALQEGIQAVNVLSNSALSVQFEGRTLVNLLGRDGNCEDLSRFEVYNPSPGATVELDENIKKYGLKSFKFTGNGAGVFRFLTVEVNPNSYYVAILEYYHQSGNEVGGLAIGDGSAVNSNYGVTIKVSRAVVGKNNEWQLVKVKFKGDETPTGKVTISASTITGTSDAVFNVDGIRLYELTEEEYNALDGMTDEEIAALYPYVDSVQHTRNPYVISYGKNLLPSFTSGKWQLHQNAKVISPYELELNADGAAQSSNLYIPVIPNTTYTLSYETNQVDVAYINVGWLDENDNLISWTEEHKEVNTFTSPANAVKARIAVTNKGAGVFYFKNPQLELGDTATEFETYEETYLFGKDVVLAEGERAYQNADGEWRKWQEWEQVELDGIFNWTISRSYRGHKTVRTENIVSLNKEDGYTLEQYKSVKFDGKILNSSGSDTVTDSAIFYNSSGEGIRSGTIAITVSNQDSGWGDDYTPTPGEIKAYFNGWQMNNGTFGQPYNGTGTKTWVPLGDTDNNRATTTLPTITSPTITEGKITHYQLHYKLAEPREVPIEFEGSLRVREGLNQIEVGTGVVVRERAEFLYSTINHTHWNNMNGGDLAEFRVDEIKDVYKNQSKFTLYEIRDDIVHSYGNCRVQIQHENFDPTAVYHVTYFVLDKHLFTAGLGGITAEYNLNFATRLEENEKELIAQVRKVSVLENELFPLLQGEIVDHNLHVENPPLGYYVRYANGLQMCFSTDLRVEEEGGIIANTNYRKTLIYPAKFIGRTSAYAGINNLSSQHDYQLFLNVIATDTYCHVFIRPSVNQGFITINYLAIGRWK